MLDFTSSLYLGLSHGSTSLLPWPSLTSGRPAALGEMPAAATVGDSLAALQGCEAAAIASSTLHLFWDLFVGFDPTRSVICLDRGTYPIARWGVERAAAQGTPVRLFGHYDPEALRRVVSGPSARGLEPVVVADGFCPSCGKPAPIQAYLDIVRERGGYLVIDDTQALGILGGALTADVPYGSGGGGSLRYAGVIDSSVILVSSLAKAFGAPIAAISGSAQTIAAFVSRAETRVHCSPPSAAALHAAAHALALNASIGERLRGTLCRLVRRFLTLLDAAGFPSSGGLFPVQTILPTPGLDVFALHRNLRSRGIAAILQSNHNGLGKRVSFIITARHHPEHLEFAVEALASAMSVVPPTRHHQGVSHGRAVERQSVVTRGRYAGG